jgi:hypothetical protein
MFMSALHASIMGRLPGACWCMRCSAHVLLCFAALLRLTSTATAGDASRSLVTTARLPSAHGTEPPAMHAKCLVTITYNQLHALFEAAGRA